MYTKIKAFALGLGTLLLFVGSGNAQTHEPFTMVFASDPQLHWGCQQEFSNPRSSPISDFCEISSNYSKSAKFAGETTNSLQSQRIQYIRQFSSNFKGVVINGDLTTFGNQHGEWNEFHRHYNKSDFVDWWPGLGNHDYENNINDCGAKASPNYNYCAADMIEFLAERIRNGDITNSSYDISKYEENPLQVGSQKNVSGSLAYSWDIGNFHFVQLNNYPTYEKNFKHGYDLGVSSWDFNINSAVAWLQSDLSKAAETRKRIVLNWHRWTWDNQEFRTQEREKIKTALQPFRWSIKAIFVGHEHSKFGYLGETIDYPDVSIPILSTGSAIWNRFIRAEFRSALDTTIESCSITTQVMNGYATGTARSSDGRDGSFPINCVIGARVKYVGEWTTPDYWKRDGCESGGRNCSPPYSNVGTQKCPVGSVMVGAGLVQKGNRQVLKLICRNPTDRSETNVDTWTANYWKRDGCESGGDRCSPVYANHGLYTCPNTVDQMVGAGLTQNGNRQVIELICRNPTTSNEIEVKPWTADYWKRNGCESGGRNCSPPYSNVGTQKCPDGSVMVGAGLVIRGNRQVVQLACRET